MTEYQNRKYNSTLAAARAIRRCQTTAELEKVTTSRVQELGYNGYSYLETDGAEQFLLHACSYSDTWPQRYLEMGYGEIDPIIDLMFSSDDAYSWHYNEYQDSNERVKSFFEDAKCYGAVCGIGVPMKKDGDIRFFGTVTSNANQDLRADLPILRTLAHNYNMVHIAIHSGGKDTVSHGFTERELQCLHLMALGCKPAEMAEILDLTKRTIEQHISSLREKTGARTQAAAVSITSDTGVLTVKELGFEQFSRPRVFSMNKGKNAADNGEGREPDRNDTSRQT